MTAHADGNEDPDLSDIDDLARLERRRPPSSRRVRTGSTALIVGVAVVLVILGIAAAWIAG